MYIRPVCARALCGCIVRLLSPWLQKLFKLLLLLVVVVMMMMMVMVGIVLSDGGSGDGGGCGERRDLQKEMVVMIVAGLGLLVG